MNTDLKGKGSICKDFLQVRKEENRNCFLCTGWEQG